MGTSVADAFFGGRPRAVRAVTVGAAVEDDSSGSAAFLGRPRAALLVAGTSLCSCSSSSSALVFRLAAVLFVLAVAVDFALAAAVTILVDAMAGSVAFAAARDRVIRLGGESMILDLCAGVRACVFALYFCWASRQWVYMLFRWVSGVKEEEEIPKTVHIVCSATE